MSEKILFINIIKQCNMHCDRCYLTETSRKDPLTLSEEALERVLTSSWASQGEIGLIWEGGEASLAGRAHFRRLLERSRELLPHARQTMVTNLFNLPNWLVELSHEFFKGKIETTLAMNGKFSLSKDLGQFLTRFSKNHLKASRAGIVCPINLELNDHTVALGAPALIDFLEPLAPCRVEFDVSVDFEAFLKAPAYTLHGYPLLPLTASYLEFANFVKCFSTQLRERGLDRVINSSLIDEMREKKESSMFAVQRGADFLTLNPDGTLTTNPLFSDLAPTFLGNVLTDSMDTLLNSRKRSQFIRHELRKTLECHGCDYLSLCSGGPSHAPTFDGSGECSGMKSLRSFFGNDQ